MKKHLLLLFLFFWGAVVTWCADGDTFTATTIEGEDITYTIVSDHKFEAISHATYALSVKATGNGSASYGGTNIRNATKTFTMIDVTSATITFSPDNGYRIKYVKKDGNDVTSYVLNNQYTVSNFKSDTNIEVEFEAITTTNEFTLTIKAIGGGTVTFNRTEVRDKTISFSVKQGTNPVLTIIPDYGCQVKSLTNNGLDAAAFIYDYAYTIYNVKSDITVVVEFEAKKESYKLSINASGSGSVWYAGNEVRNGTETFPLEDISSVYFYFKPDDGSKLKSVIINGANVTPRIFDNTYTIREISSNVTLQAEFETIEPAKHILSIKSSGKGSVKYNGSSVKETTTTFTVNEGTNAVLSFVPDNGYRIKSMIINGVDLTASILNNAYTISNINKNTTVEVEFEAIPPNTYILTIKAAGNGSASYNSIKVANGSQSFSVKEHSSATIEFTPDNGYRIKSVMVNGADVTNTVSNNRYTINDIKANCTIDVVFEAIPVMTYTLSVKSTGNGSTYYGDTPIRNTTNYFTVPEGSSVSVSLSPDDSYRVKVLKVNGVDSTNGIVGGLYTVADIKSDIVLEIVFEAIPPIIHSYILSIKAIGNGSVSYNNVSVRNATNTFTVTEGTSATITLLRDSGCRLKSLRVNDADHTQDVKNGEYTVSNIQSGVAVEVEFEAGALEISYEDVNYIITSFTDKTVSLARGDYGKVLEVPSMLFYDGAEWTVTGVTANTLANNKDLAAIIWYPRAAFTEQVSNPNMLLYVSADAYAPSSVKNVVVSGTARNIELTEAAQDNDFCCPREFTAQSISYTHRYNMTTGIGESRGWETIVLPFDVQKVTHETKGEMLPFALWKSGDAKKPFWLKTLGGSGWTDANAIKANTPYIISMPNHPDYKDEFQLNGKVTFSAKNVTVRKTNDIHTVSQGNKQFVPSFANQEIGAGIFLLNVVNDLEQNTGGAIEGSRFIYNLRQLHPFEAYIKTSSGGRYIAIDDMNADGILDLLADRETRIIVYNMKGLLVVSTKDKTMEEMLRLLPAGVYIVNGKKLLVK